MVLTFFARYTTWHYFKAPGLLLRVWSNLLWYVGHFFSVTTLWRSLFAPWRRIVAERTKRWDFEDFASAVVANIIARVIGVVMRLSLIIIGRTLQLLLFCFGVFFYVLWFVLPVLMVGTFLYGFQFIF